MTSGRRGTRSRTSSKLHPNVGAAVGLAAAVTYLQRIGMSAVRDHERGLVAPAMTALSALPGVRIYGPSAAERSGVVSFTVDGIRRARSRHRVGRGSRMHPGRASLRTAADARAGVAATARASFFVYNDPSDVDALVAGVQRAQSIFGVDTRTQRHATVATQRA